MQNPTNRKQLHVNFPGLPLTFRGYPPKLNQQGRRVLPSKEEETISFFWAFRIFWTILTFQTFTFFLTQDCWIKFHNPVKRVLIYKSTNLWKRKMSTFSRSPFHRGHDCSTIIKIMLNIREAWVNAIAWCRGGVAGEEGRRHLCQV